MLIRSQNKKKITNLSQVTGLVVSHDKRIEEWEIIACYPYFADNDCGFTALATYSTEEKAIKVLDMICNFADEKHYEKIVTEKCGCISGVVFDMPQDSEV